MRLLPASRVDGIVLIIFQIKLQSQLGDQPWVQPNVLVKHIIQGL